MAQHPGLRSPSEGGRGPGVGSVSLPGSACPGPCAVDRDEHVGGCRHLPDSDRFLHRDTTLLLTRVGPGHERAGPHAVGLEAGGRCTPQMYSWEKRYPRASL